jgi:hypothetical protein
VMESSGYPAKHASFEDFDSTLINSTAPEIILAGLPAHLTYGSLFFPEPQSTLLAQTRVPAGHS